MSAKVSAVALALLTLLPALAVSVPPAAATHTTPLHAYGVDGIPLVKYDDRDCLITRLARIPSEVPRSPAPGVVWSYVSHEGTTVPALCAGAADAAGKEAVEGLRRALVSVNEVVRFLENQTQLRRGLYVPSNRTTFLFDDFEPGTRKGGYGDWNVVSVTGSNSDASDATFTPYDWPARYMDPDGGLRFFDPTTGLYPAGADVALVSPEIDLYAADAPGNEGGQRLCMPNTGQCFNYITGPRDAWNANLASNPILGQFGRSLIEPTLTAWEKQSVVTLTIKHRYNFADGKDGLRLEVWDHPPTADELRAHFSLGSSRDPTELPQVIRPNDMCDGTLPSHEIAPTGCTYMVPADSQNPVTGQPIGGRATTTPLSPPSFDYYESTTAFTPRRGAQTCTSACLDAFSGSTYAKQRAANSPNPNTAINATFDLSPYAGQSVWLVLRVRTTIDVDFTDESQFPTKGDIGYFLDSVNVTAKAKTHNLRVKGTDPMGSGSVRTLDVASPDLVTRTEDGTGTEQTILPHVLADGTSWNGTDEISFYVTNFGRHRENAYATVTIREDDAEGDVLKRINLNRTLEPGDVWRVAVPLPIPSPETGVAADGIPREGDAFWFRVNASLQNQEDPLPLNEQPTLNGGFLEGDYFQPRNEPTTAKDNQAEVVVRARLVRSIEAQPFGDGTLFMIDPAIDAKDKVRTISARLRNVGNTAEEITVVPSLRDDKDRRDFFTGEVERELGVLRPGEERFLTWQIRPYISGTYLLSFAFLNESTNPSFLLGGTPVRTLYVGRTAGVVCGDDLAFRRECVPGWTLAADEELRGKALTAGWRSPSGDLWGVGPVGPHGKAEAFVRRDGAWVNLTDPLRVETPLVSDSSLRAVHGFRDDLVYVVGEGDTILRYDGAWTRIPIEDPTAPAGLVRSLRGVWGPDPSRVFVVGENGTVLQLNETGTVRFEPAKNVHPVGANLNAVSGIGTTAFAVGDASTVLRWDGRYWNRSNLSAGAPLVSLRDVHVIDPRHAIAGGDAATVLAFNSTNDLWFGNTTTGGAPSILAFTATPDGAMYALGQDGLVMRCEDCLLPKGKGRWVPLSSATPLVARADATPRLTAGRHLAEYNSHLQAPANGNVDFYVTYADPEGRRPEFVRLQLKKGLTTTTYAMTWTNAGDHTTGAVYHVRRALETGAYTYSFSASDGASEVATAATGASFPVVEGSVTAGGDCFTGADGTNTRTTGTAGIYPAHAPVVCTGRLDGPGTQVDHSDFVKFHAAAGRTIRVWLNASNAIVAPDFRIDLYDSISSTTPVATADVNEPAGLSFATATGGTFYLNVVATATGGAQDYALSVKTTPASATSPLLAIASPASVFQDTTARASVFGAASGPLGEDAIAFVEGGYLLDYWNDGLFENSGDWIPDYHLEPTHTDANGNPAAWHGGGNTRSDRGSIRAMNASASPLPTSDYTAIKLRVRHFVHSAYGEDADNNLATPHDEDLPQIRLGFLLNPERRYQGLVDTDAFLGDVLPQTCTSYHVESAGGNPTNPSCARAFAAVKTYRAPHAYEGWQEEDFDLTQLIVNHTTHHPDTQLGSVEFYVPSVWATGKEPFRTTQWAIDEIKLVGVLPNGTEESIVHWAGTDVEGTTTRVLPPAIGLLGTPLQPPWAISRRPIYNNESDPEGRPEGSLWRLSSDTDAATWVANRLPADPDGFASLKDVRGIQSILVTPAVDLRQVFNPVLEFQHVFSGRFDNNLGTPTCFYSYDLGSVFVSQWDPDAAGGRGAWTRFQPLQPEGGYPGRGYNGLTNRDDCNSHPVPANAESYNGFRFGQGFWGRTHVPDGRGVLSAAQTTANYERVRMRLNQESPESDYFHDELGRAAQPKYAGGIVRFAFVHNASRFGDETKTSTPLEGWYVRDLRVLAEEKLGNDLVLRNFSLNVGYDWARTGVGPGTTVPVNVTVENQGLYDVNGFKVQLVVTKVLDPVRGLTRVVARDEVRYDPNILPKESRNFTLAWPVASLPAGVAAESYVVSAVVVPLGRPDENDADNVRSVGDLFHPVVATVTRDVRAYVTADPRAESASVTRYVPVFIDNRGNVPVTGLTVTRSIVDIRGGYQQESKWTTTRPAPEGQVTIVSALAEDVDVTRDLYWVPPEPSSFLATARVLDPVTGRETRSEILIESQTTFLFDDFDRSTIGTSFRGGFRANGFLLDPDGGFGDTKAYRFGDATTGIYTIGRDGVLDFPTVDLSSATTAKLTFRHAYEFEKGYDGGVVEASLDGGVTWQVLTPSPSPGLPGGYPDVTVSAGSSVDPTHDPRRALRAFTGSSADVPGAIDGWVTSQVNLGQIEAMVRQTAYDRFDAQAQRSDLVKACAFDGEACRGARYYADGSWLVGDAKEYRFYQIDNLTDDTVRANSTDVGFIWSGSPRTDDDGKAALDSVLLVPLDLRDISSSSNQRVELRFREWMRHDGMTTEIHDDHGPTYDIVTELDPPASTRGSTYRSHWQDTKFHLVAREGDWWTWAVDLSDYRGTSFDLHFIHRISDNGADLEDSADSEWGWVIDSMEIYTYTESGGQRLRGDTLLDHEAATNVARGLRCDPRTDDDGIPCIGTATRNAATAPVALDVTGAAAASADGIVFLFGGRDATGDLTDDVVRFDPRTGDSSVVAHLPSAREDATAAFDGEGIWIVGGRDDDGVLDEVLYYVPGATQVDVNAAALPAGRAGAAAVYAAGALYVLGGSNGAAPTASAYRVTTASATPLADLPAPREDAHAVFDGARYVFLFGTGDVIRLDTTAANGAAQVAQHQGAPVATAATSGAFLDASGLVYVIGATTFATFDPETHALGTSVGHTLDIGTRTAAPAPECGAVRFVGDAGANDAAYVAPRGLVARCGEIGREWGVASALPSIPSAWTAIGLDSAADRKYVGQLRDSRGSKLLPTGEEARIWWTGRKAPLPPNPSVQQVTEATTPGAADSRLVTPAIDLSRIAGGGATLKFNHTYNFWNYSVGSFTYGDLGVVEIQVYDRARAAWGDWEQLYKPIPSGLVGGITNRQFAGGYPKALAATGEQAGRALWVETGLPSHWNETTKRSYVYAYMEYSNPDAPYGWVPEAFDLSPYLGERVRIGFRYITVTAHAERGSTTGNSANGAWTLNAFGVNTGPGSGGWFIDDVEVIGATLVGQPVQLRMRAASDGSIGKGGWVVDDIALSGATYERNVGLFADPLPNGIAPGRNVTVTGTLRNLADGVRRNLGVQIVDATLNPLVALNFTPVPIEGKGIPTWPEDESEPTAYLAGVNLGPRSAVKFQFTVAAPEAMQPDPNVPRRLLLRVVEYNTAAGTFLPIRDNEVEGFAEIEFYLPVDSSPRAKVDGFRVVPAVVKAGEKARLELTINNTGVMPLHVMTTCTVARVDGYEPGDHTTSDHTHLFDPAVACTPVTPAPIVPAGSTRLAVYEFTPARAGHYSVKFTGNISDGETAPEDLRENGLPDGNRIVERRVLVGVSPLFLREDFEGSPTWKGDPADYLPCERDDSRGRSAKASMRCGLTDGEFTATSELDDTYTLETGSTGGGTTRTLVSSAFDLHNLTQGPVYLRFAHLPRFARYDGGDVVLQIQANEFLPDSSWLGRDCKIFPVTGYDGPVGSFFSLGNPGDQYSPDVNPGFPQPGNFVQTQSRWYMSDDPTAPGNTPELAARRVFFTGFEEQWRVATFDLTNVKCNIAPDGAPARLISPLGHTVRFVFRTYMGAGDSTDACENNPCPDPFSRRGRGQGWFIDDVHVSSFALAAAPKDGSFAVLDNAMKVFPTILSNPSEFPTRLRYGVDEIASSVPKGTVRTESGTITLAPRESRIVNVTVALPRDPSLLPLVYEAKVVAESLDDANVLAERVLRLDFSPRRWPDLRVTIEKPAGTVQEGTKSYLPITIENYGLVTAPAPKVVVIEETGGERKVHEIPAENLRAIPSYFDDPVESTLVTEFQWTPLPGRGARSLTVVVDPDGLLEEYVKADNTFRLDLEVSRLLQPDLALSEGKVALRVGGQTLTPKKDGDVVRYEVEANDLVTIEVAVANDGPVGATNVNLDGFIGFQQLPRKALPFIPAGSEALVPFTWLAQKGEYALQFTAGTDLVELDEANNRIPRQGLVILTVKGFDVTATLDTPKRLIQPGESFTANLTLANGGISGQELRLTATAPAGWTAVVEQPIVFLAKGRVGDDAMTVPVRVTAGEKAVAGEQALTVRVAALDNPAKRTEAIGKVTVKAVYGLDVRADAHAAPPGEIDVPVVLTNAGNSPEPVRVTATLPAGWRLRDSPVRVSVTPWSTETKGIPVETQAGAAAGTYEIGLTFTLPNGATRTSTVPVVIKEWRNVDFEVVSATPTGRQDRLQYEVRLVNSGNVRAPFDLLTPNLPAGWSVYAEPSTATLAPGASVVATLTVQAPEDVKAGEYVVPLYAHFTGVQPATVEGLANIDRISIKIAKPDTLVREFGYTPRANIEPLTRLNVRAAVENDGSMAAREVTVALFVDDVFMDAVILPALAPGERREVSLNWTTVGGKHTLTVVVDPFRDLLETNRENNAVTRVVVIGGDQETVRGLPAQTVRTPGFDAPLALLALVGLAALGRIGRSWRLKK